MKILLLCWRDTTHPQGGGSERYLEHIGRALAAEGHEVIYRTARGSRKSHKEETTDGIRFIRRGGKLSVYITAAGEMLLGRVGIGQLKHPDVIVDTHNGIPFFAHLFAGAPTVLLFHHCHKEQWPVAGPVLSHLGWFIEKTLSPWIHRSVPWVTVSTPSAKELVKLGIPAENITIVRTGCDPVPTAIPHLSNDSTAGGEVTHLVTLSRLVPHKQIEHAMDVVAALAPVMAVHLDIIGSGWWDTKLKAYAMELGVADKVTFTGQVDEETKHALLDRAAVHLMPSRKEGWGIAVTEAAQHGVPTVGYRKSGGLKESVVDNVTGLLVEDKAELIAATATLISDDTLRNKLGREAKIRAAALDWGTAAARFTAVLKKTSTVRPPVAACHRGDKRRDKNPPDKKTKT